MGEAGNASDLFLVLTDLVCTTAHSQCDTEGDSCKELVMYVKKEHNGTYF